MKNIYAIRDRIAQDLAGQFPLVVLRTDAQAIRYFADSIEMKGSALGTHPKDYELIKCGEVNDIGAVLPVGATFQQDKIVIGNSEPIVIITGDALITMMQDQQHSTVQLVKEA